MPVLTSSLLLSWNPWSATPIPPDMPWRSFRSALVPIAMQFGMPAWSMTDRTLSICVFVALIADRQALDRFVAGAQDAWTAGKVLARVVIAGPSERFKKRSART